MNTRLVQLQPGGRHELGVSHDGLCEWEPSAISIA
jgi:hypothetical protein